MEFGESTFGLEQMSKIWWQMHIGAQAQIRFL